MHTPTHPALRDQSCPENTDTAPRSVATFTFGTGNVFSFQGAESSLVNHTTTKKEQIEDDCFYFHFKHCRVLHTYRPSISVTPSPWQQNVAFAQQRMRATNPLAEQKEHACSAADKACGVRNAPIPLHSTQESSHATPFSPGMRC